MSKLLISRLKKTKSYRDWGLIVAAIDYCDSDRKIQQFYDEYVTLLRRSGEDKETRENPEHVVSGNIRYTLGYGFSKKTKRKWIKIIDNNI